MSALAAKRKRHLFAAPPTSAELAAVLPAPRADRLSYTASNDSFEVGVAARPVWLLLPGLVWFGVVVTVAPWMAPLWGGQFMGWGRWCVLMLVNWIVLLPAVLVLLSWLVQRKHAGESVLVVDLAAGKLYLPTGDRAVAVGELFQVVEVIRWAEDERQWKPVVQTSLVLLVAEGGFEVVPLVTEVRPSPFGMPLADRLGDVFGVPIIRVQLSDEESRPV